MAGDSTARDAALTVALVQRASSLDPAENHAALASVVAKAVRREPKPSLVVLPEAFARDFGKPGSDVSPYAEPVDGPFVVESREGTGAAVEVVPVPAFHGRLPVLGFRVGRFAYLTDVSAVPDANLALLTGLDTLVLDGLRPEPHPTHLSFEEATAVARTIGARDTVFTHLSHSARHADVSLPPGVRLGYDGLVLEVDP